ncbi:TPA: Dam family site-specific DNA-(adenine-N6)-methyltransferase [Enterobacter hormaechei subsp. xiangfangensis]|nr:Dam family site-specific DNA-(adenine-N6)-methyltransferase [Enterobacter hormaechei subsp. xiangfangensis]
MSLPLSYGSICSGIEAASVAWEPLGLIPEWFSQFDPEHDYANGPDFPSLVLAERWPEVPNLGDMTKIAALVRAGTVNAPDVLVGGTPCQAWSIAGNRDGLDDPRGALTLSYVELVNAIDKKRRAEKKPPVMAVWENVPGVLSSDDNGFGCFLAGLAGESEPLQPAGEKWADAGCVIGPVRTIAWRVLNAKFFGVAQYRRRVFVIATARRDFDPCEALLEPESGPGTYQAHIEREKYLSAGADGSTLYRFRRTDNYVQDVITSTLAARDYKERRDLVLTPDRRVRCLTASEYEKFQGFSGTHTLITVKGKPATDAPRYKALGNSMAVPVMRWIMERILLTLATCKERLQVAEQQAMTKKKKAEEKASYTRPFLKWPGGKHSVLDQILPHMGFGKRLIEPFVGAGSIFLNAFQFERYLLADNNADLIALYQAIKDDPQGVIDAARAMFNDYNSKDGFRKARVMYNKKAFGPTYHAAAFLYLNRHCFNGLMRYNLSGEFNTSYGHYKKPYFPEQELQDFILWAKNCEFKAQGFIETLREAGSDDVVFCDPPYMPLPDTNGFTSYTDEPFTDEHHWQLLNEMVAAFDRGARVIVTNSGAPALKEAYEKAGFRLYPLHARRSMSCKGATRGVANDILGVLSWQSE